MLKTSLKQTKIVIFKLKTSLILKSLFLGTQNEPSGTPPKGSWSSRDHFWSKWPLAETRKQPFLRQLQNGENELPERDPPRGGPKDLKIVAFKLKTRLKQLK